MREGHPTMRRLPLATLVFFAISVPLAAPWLGVETISPLGVLQGRVTHMELEILWQLRLPRILLAWCAGATFGLCGMVFQALFRNPLAEPSLLGVSSGAALGAAVAIHIGAGAGALSYLNRFHALANLAVSTSAFAGALVAIAVIVSFSQLVRGSRDATLLLAGIAISALFSSLIMVLQYTGSAVETYKLLSWTMGGINVIGMSEGLRALPPMLLTLFLALFFAMELDIVTFGDEIALTKGVALERVRNILFVGMSLSVAMVVANCGPIAFLGLIAPHIGRRFVGHAHRKLAPVTAMIGGTSLVLCDTAARTFWAPADLPVGIIVSFLGAPFFLWLLLHGGGIAGRRRAPNG